MAKTQKIPLAWNKTGRQYPRELCVQQLFEEQVERTPNAIAIVDGETAYTYRTLNESANRLAHYLRKRGVGPEIIVGCHLSRSYMVVLYVLAVLKAGGAYLLLDAHLPAGRLEYLVGNAEPIFIVSDESWPALATVACPKLTTTQMESEAQKEAASNLPPLTTPQHAAYIAYTSGSTGRPKGVLITHQSLVNHAYAFAKLFRLRPTDRVPLIAPIAFDMATEEMLPPLVSGCTLVASQSQPVSMKEFTDEIIANKYTILNIAAPLWHQWTEYLSAAGRAIPPSLRLVITGSDKIYTQHFMLWKELPGAKDVAWASAYGTTETTVTNTLYLTAWDDDLSDEVYMPIGKPIANNRAYILDEQLLPVRVGEIGELYIAGDSVGRGYKDLPAKTQQQFLADPFATTRTERMYKTGDLARYRQDGTIVCLGRKDNQIKRDGLRIELGEIEAVLMEHPRVHEAAVVVRGEGPSMQLIAFLAVPKTVEFAISEVRALAEDSLHPHMLPDHYIPLAMLPLNANGKIDRRTLEQKAIDH